MATVLNCDTQPIDCGEVSVVPRVRSVPYVPIVAAIAIVAGTYWFSPNFIRQSGPDAPPYAGDLIHEWLGGYIVRHGDYSRFYNVPYAIQLQHNPELIGYQWKETEYLPIVYPPFYYILVSPLSLLPVRVAAWVWGVLMVAALVAVVLALVRANRQTGSLAGWLDGAMDPSLEDSRDGTNALARKLWREYAPWLLPLAMFFSPLLENLVSSQKGTVCLLILTSTFLLLDFRRPFTAGLVFGLLAFKPQLTLVIAFSMLYKRQWRFVAGGATMGALLVALSFSLGYDVCRQFFNFSTGMANYVYTEGYDLTKSHCLYGFFTLTLGVQWGVGAKVATLLSTSGIALLLTTLLRGEIAYGQPRFSIQFAGLVVATLLLSPHLFSYDLTVLLLPMFLLVVPRIRAIMPARQRNLVLWLTTGLFAVAGLSQDVARATHVQLTTIFMVCLVVLLARIADGEKRIAPAISN